MLGAIKLFWIIIPSANETKNVKMFHLQIDNLTRLIYEIEQMRTTKWNSVKRNPQSGVCEWHLYIRTVCVCMPNVSDTVKKADMTVTEKITECAFAVKMSDERETERELERDRHRAKSEGAKSEWIGFGFKVILVSHKSYQLAVYSNETVIIIPRSNLAKSYSTLRVEKKKTFYAN